MRVLLLLFLGAAFTVPAGAQTQVEGHPCVQKDEQYTCDKTAFSKILTAARTVSIHVPSRDVAAAAQLAGLARSLGKTVQPSSPDLTLELAAPDNDGIYYGPSDRELGELRVYGRASENAPGVLLWVETYSGQPDTPPATVTHGFLDQFRHNFPR